MIFKKRQLGEKNCESECANFWDPTTVTGLKGECMSVFGAVSLRIAMYAGVISPQGRIMGDM